MKKIATLAIVSAVLLLASAARAEIVTTIVTDADAFVYLTSVDTPYGDRDTIQLRSYGGLKKGYVDFDLSGLDADKPVTAAELRVTQSRLHDVFGTPLLKIFAIMDETEDWHLPTLSEAQITWNNAMASAGGPQNESGTDFVGEATGYNAVTRWLADVELGGDDETDYLYTIDVTGLIQWALGQDSDFSGFSQTDDHLSIVMRNIGGDVRFHSKEGSVDDAPRLVITQVPEPATMGLLALGFAGMAVLRRRRR